MPPRDLVTRIRQVALGLDALAKDLAMVFGDPPKNLSWWRQELLSVAEELERTGMAGGGRAGEASGD